MLRKQLQLLCVSLYFNYVGSLLFVGNRWRRRKLPANFRDEVIPKNILMIGPTGVGKTEIARRLAKIISAPFIKVRNQT